jgi:predicted thioesterase
VTRARSELLTRNSSAEPPDQDIERHVSVERTRQAIIVGEERSEDLPDPTLDGTNTSVIYRINVNNMLATRYGRRPELLSRGTLGKPDPSY